MGRAALGKVLAGLVQAEGAVHRQPDIEASPSSWPSSSHQQTGHNASAPGASSVL